MFSQRSPEYIAYLEKRLTRLESRLNFVSQGQTVVIDSKPWPDDIVWDNATLMQEWKICERTAANYRLQGLEHFKRGGRIYYSPEQRQGFLNQKKKGVNNE